MPLYQRILVIKLGAFGDVVLCFGVMQALRAHYPNAHITLLTIPLFEDMMRQSGYVDDVWLIRRWPWWQPRNWLNFAKALRAGNYDCVYDLQRNDRTTMLRRLAPASLRRAWFGGKGGSGAPYAEGALVADIKSLAVPALEWLDVDISKFSIPSPFVLLVPGSAPQHPLKRWPAASYAAVAQTLAFAGYTPVIIGTAAEADIIASIKQQVPAAVDLGGKTTLADVGALARKAAGAVGNDTGPMHLIAAAGCPSLSLFSGITSPAQSAPKGAVVKTMQGAPIETLAAEDVAAGLLSILR
ncbi:MAG: glycosyltransferase family 9 protein [Micavibrio sp.]|nr:glycosyltransferase family 9 protein [Micavibrio sp.]